MAGALVFYSRGYEAQEVRFIKQESFGLVPFAEPVLCVKAIGGPFEFNVDVMPIEEGLTSYDFRRVPNNHRAGSQS